MWTKKKTTITFKQNCPTLRKIKEKTHLPTHTTLFKSRHLAYSGKSLETWIILARSLWSLVFRWHCSKLLNFWVYMRVYVYASLYKHKVCLQFGKCSRETQMQLRNIEQLNYKGYHCIIIPLLLTDIIQYLITESFNCAVVKIR